MTYILLTLTFTAMTMQTILHAQPLDSASVKSAELQLDDVMEIIDTSELKMKLHEVERKFQSNPNLVNKTRLGIIYHEAALNLSFLSATEYKGYAQKSCELLEELAVSSQKTSAFAPFIDAYRASATALASAETKKLKLLSKSFALFDKAVKKYAGICYAPEFLRGSVAENLPWFFFQKRKFATKDFQSIINKQEKNPAYANWKVMSFTYWAWVKQHSGKKDKKLALTYLNRAIALDLQYKAGRARAEKLMRELTDIKK